MKKMSIIILLSFVLFGCKTQSSKQMRNPLGEFKLGEAEHTWKKKVIQNICDTSFKFCTRDENIIPIRHAFIRENDSIITFLFVNVDGYPIGNLRSLVFTFSGGDYYLGRFHSTNFMKRKVKTIEKLYNWFVDYYGQPNDTLQNLNLEYNSFTNVLSLDEKFNYYFLFPPLESKVYKWNLPNYTIEFCKGEHPASNNDFVYRKDTSFLEGGYIAYKIKNQEIEIKNIIEKILANKIPSDFIDIEINKFYWDLSNYSQSSKIRFVIEIEAFFRKMINEELRSITDIKYDVVLKDAFDEEIYRFKNLIVSFNEPLVYSFSKLQPINGFKLTWEYNLDKSYVELEKARRLEQNGVRIKCFAEPIAIVFEDGYILKK